VLSLLVVPLSPVRVDAAVGAAMLGDLVDEVLPAAAPPPADVQARMVVRT
jgi:hypothetical protein